MIIPMKVITVLGTRPEIIKLSPVIDLLEKDSFFDHKIIHTGQHYDFNMDRVFFDELHLPEPDFMLNVGSHPRDEQLKLMTERISSILDLEKPDLVIVQGDTNSTLAGARAAKKCGIKLMHIEAGCRSFNKEMPEEINRIEVDRLANYLMVPDTYARANIDREERESGITFGKIVNCGSTTFDAVLRNKIFANINILQELGLQPGNFVLVTIHRAENTADPKFSNIIGALQLLSEKVNLLFPVHPRTRKIIEQHNIKFNENVKLIEPQSYFNFLALLSSCRFCISDSGGVQEEVAALGIPCLIPRNETEWQKLVDDGRNILMGTDSEKIYLTCNSLLESNNHQDKSDSHNLSFYSGASQNIVNEIKTILRFIHPTADISSQAQLGNQVKIWHHSQVREQAVIGDNCILGKNVYVDKNVIIGKNCKIQNNSSIYHGVILEDGVFIGPHCVLTNDKHPRAIDRDGKLKSDIDWMEGHILIKYGASLGARVVVLPDVTIGQFALVGAGSVVTKDVPDFGLVYGNPARLQGYVCYCGNKLEESKNAGEKCGKCQ